MQLLGVTHPHADAVCLAVRAVVVPQGFICVEDIVQQARQLHPRAVQHTPRVAYNTQGQLALNKIGDLGA
jgi:hypothetical protein